MSGLRCKGDMVHTYKEVKVVTTFGDTRLDYICERCGALEGDDVPCKDRYPIKSKL